jgi:hypothetical protein
VVGSIAANLHEGSRSEILADYLFSGWGVVTPVRRQDDHGIDLYGGLTERRGQRAVVTDYYVVQVKSSTDPWKFEDAEQVRWLIEYPLPIFLSCVDKTTLSLSVYHVTPRFAASTSGSLRSRLELVPGDEGEGKCTGWDNAVRFDLSAPILRATLADLVSLERVAKLRDVFKCWVHIDRANIDLRNAGILRYRMPYSYRTNEIPARATHPWIEVGNQFPDDANLHRGMLRLAEALDCLGDQLRARGDPKAALLSTMLLDHIQRAYPEALQAHPPLNERLRGSLGSSVSNDLNRAMAAPPGTYQFAGIDTLMQTFAAVPQVQSFLSQRPQPGEQSGD